MPRNTSSNRRVSPTVRARPEEIDGPPHPSSRTRRLFLRDDRHVQRREDRLDRVRDGVARAPREQEPYRAVTCIAEDEGTRVAAGAEGRGRQRDDDDLVLEQRYAGRAV